VINRFQGVSFQVAEAAMLLDASRALVHTTACAADAAEAQAPDEIVYE
jgi:alkylation response protein AidB-like acyl-CoA dehydrogenase